MQWKVLIVSLAACALAPVMSAAEGAGDTDATTGAAVSPRLYVVLYQAGPAWKAGRTMAEQELKAHAQYYRKLLDQGRVVGGGRFEGIEKGMAILRADSLEEAEAILALDPAVTNGVFTADLRVWTPRFFDEALAPPSD